MNRSQINRKEMYEAVLQFFNDHPTQWSSIPKVGEFINEFTQLNVAIDQAQEAQQSAQVFVGKNKTQLKKGIATKADILNDALEAFALVEGDSKLQSRMAASYTDLYETVNARFVPRIMEIVTEAENHQEVLTTEYGVSPQQMESLKQDVDQFLALSGQPRAYRIASVQATRDLEQLFAEASELLSNKLDKVMSLFKRRDANFYNGYLAARVVVDN